MSDMQFCEAHVRAVKAETDLLGISFSIGEEEFAELGRSVLIDVGTEKSELLVSNRLRTYPFRGLNTMPTSTQMTGASFPAVSLAKVRNEQQQRWNRSWLHRRSNRLASEGDRPQKRSKDIVSE
jgi:hypothetical protein